MPDSIMPPDFSDVAIVLTHSECMAMRDAVLIFDLMVDGCIADAVDLTRGDDGGLSAGQMEHLEDVRAKIDKAYKREDEAFREFIRNRHLKHFGQEEGPNT